MGLESYSKKEPCDSLLSFTKDEEEEEEEEFEKNLEIPKLIFTIDISHFPSIMVSTV